MRIKIDFKTGVSQTYENVEDVKFEEVGLVIKFKSVAGVVPDSIVIAMSDLIQITHLF